MSGNGPFKISNNWYIPIGPVAQSWANVLPPNFIDPQDFIKSSKLRKLFHVGVVFQHKNSKVLWKIVKVIKGEDGQISYAVAQSLSSKYKKTFWPESYYYDNLILHEAPEAVRVLFGDQKHQVESQPVQTAEEAFELGDDPKFEIDDELS